MIQAVLRNAAHPEYGEATIPFPIPEEEYGHCLELLEALEIGNAVNRDCKVQEVQDGPPILKRLEGSRVNLDELDYLAKRLDSFTDQELAQFQSAAVSYDYSNIVDLINLTFSCQEVTVITDFSDLESIGRNHYMTLNGGSARMEELDNLDGTETALLLIESGDGVITPYGVVYDNCMRLSQDYDGRHLPEYYYTRCTVSVMLSADGRPEQQEMLYFPCAESKISRAVRRLGVDRPEQCTATLKLAEVSDAVRGTFRWHTQWSPAGEKARRSSGTSRDQDSSYRRSQTANKIVDDPTSSQEQVTAAFGWLKQSASAGDRFAQYLLGKLLLQGDAVPKDIPGALRYLHASAEQGSQYAQYALGKLYLLGKEIPPDREAAAYWFTLSAAQGNEYARYFLDHMAQSHSGSVFACSTQLLWHMSRIFEEETPRSPIRTITFTDRKLRRRITEKKIAMGHKADDHEEIRIQMQ